VTSASANPPGKPRHPWGLPQRETPQPEAPEPAWPLPSGPQPRLPPPGSGSEPDRPPLFSHRNGCLLVSLIMLGLISLLFVSCIAVLHPLLQVEDKLKSDLGTRATNVDVVSVNGASTFVVHLAPGHDSEGPDVACRIVEPDLQANGLAAAHFEVVDSAGHVVADNSTPCG